MEPDAFRALPSVRHAFTAEKARRAIYFDYEGLPNAPRILLGWSVQGEYRASIVDAGYKDCHQRYGAKTAAWQLHREVVCSLLRMAMHEDRHLVSWSHHDARLILPDLPDEQHDVFRNRYIDARQVARAWHSKTLGNVPPDGARLAYFAELFGAEAPPQFGEHVVAEYLQTVKQGLLTAGSYAKLAPDKKKAWRSAVKHNQWDLRVTMAVMSRVLQAGTG